MLNECSTDTVCRCCGQPYNEYRPRSYAVPNTCALCLYEAQFKVKPDEEVKHPEGRWTTKENAS